MTYSGVNYRKPLGRAQIERVLVEKLAYFQKSHDRMWRDHQELKMIVDHQKNRITSLQNEVFQLGHK